MRSSYRVKLLAAALAWLVMLGGQAIAQSVAAPARPLPVALAPPIRDQAFIQFAVQSAGARADAGMRRRAQAARLTDQERGQVAMILRDARLAAAQSRELARAASTLSSRRAAAMTHSINFAASRVDGALARQDFAALQGELVRLKGALEGLSTMGEDAQLANVDLQNILQKQQQTLQMVSNVSRMLRETARSIIQKIG